MAKIINEFIPLTKPNILIVNFEIVYAFEMQFDSLNGLHN